MEGYVTVRKGLFSSGAPKPQLICQSTKELVKAGKISTQECNNGISFAMPLEPLAGQEIFETYHGHTLDIAYSVAINVTRGMLSKNLTKTIEFVVELKPLASRRDGSKPITFTIDSEPTEIITTPKQARDKKQPETTPAPTTPGGTVKVSGRIAGDILSISSPFNGELVVENSPVPITSIELQLMRIENCSNTSGTFDKEISEIQNVQMADGDIPRNMVIPLFFIFPRLFCSPSMSSKTFNLDFEVNLIVCLAQGKAPIIKSFPIKVVRA
eukprot:TRINITY_DN6333_c0_g1_i2.p1 TRINITY_DN6333_c0_g1~~TRINITY_DN6333_c0_g1_i2.p1  ORF type:complete len:315 (-),score=40.03 TRINITY_DN6333_c0_g1_i2:29-838(-)